VARMNPKEQIDAQHFALYKQYRPGDTRAQYDAFMKTPEGAKSAQEFLQRNPDMAQALQGQIATEKYRGGLTPEQNAAYGSNPMNRQFARINALRAGGGDLNANQQFQGSLSPEQRAAWGKGGVAGNADFRAGLRPDQQEMFRDARFQDAARGAGTPAEALQKWQAGTMMPGGAPLTDAQKAYRATITPAQFASRSMTGEMTGLDESQRAMRAAALASRAAAPAASMVQNSAPMPSGETPMVDPATTAPATTAPATTAPAAGTSGMATTGAGLGTGGSATVPTTQPTVRQGLANWQAGGRGQGGALTSQQTAYRASIRPGQFQARGNNPGAFFNSLSPQQKALRAAAKLSKPSRPVSYGGLVA
jgi:hypothetical protein